MQSLKLLLVEDNDILQQIQSHMLDQLGHEVVIAADAQQALKAVQQDSFDLIIMDLILPGIDGIECTRQIKQMNIQTPIIALSGNDAQETKDACFDVGMAGFLKKPTDKKIFQFMVDQVLNR
ncbi:hypothetical protein THMIRHAS_02240 [Thiosulfatimonas sediminis]|uniref:Response regulatory domain-containing protein n=1 Tax=Thiosulfatimonas sediminis TaxID=2675054 RepID=A0A6F8PRU9_9GAMM|nr:response regulator [Thiosulfatimonas sediminis]BBP44851.1 hypothetical protein THMIRHAS_02240 [Thiosulfatimonas sediminis]